MRVVLGKVLRTNFVPYLEENQIKWVVRMIKSYWILLQVLKTTALRQKEENFRF